MQQCCCAIFLALFSWTMSGCGTPVNTSRTPRGQCVAYSTQPCNCTVGQQGIQTCLANGLQYTQCDCGTVGSTDTTDSTNGNDSWIGIDATDGKDSTDATGTTDGNDGATSTTGISGTDSTTGTSGTDSTTGTTTKEMAIHQIQTHVGSTECNENSPSYNLSTPIEENIMITNAVVTGGKFVGIKANPDKGKPQWDGYYISQGSGENSGIQLLVSSELGIELKEGQAIEVIGDYTEYYCNSQIKAKTVKVTDAGLAPDATLVSSQTIANAKTPESWEGAYVRVQNVTVTQVNEYNFVVTGGLIVSEKPYGPIYDEQVGNTIDEITGFILYAYGEYTLAANKIDGSKSTPAVISIKAIQEGTGSVDCKPGVNDEISNNFVTTHTNVQITGTVVSPSYNIFGDKQAVYVVDGFSGASTGILVVYTGESALPIGAQIQATGQVSEYYCLTEFLADDITAGAPGALPPPLAVSSDYVQKEEFEGSYVTVENVEVIDISTFETLGEFTVTGGLVVALKPFSVVFMPTLGQKISSITGAISYDYWTYKLVPFSMPQ